MRDSVNQTERYYTDSQVILRLIKYLKPHLLRFIIALILVMAGVGLSLISPLLNKELIQGASSLSVDELQDLVNSIVITMICVILSVAILDFINHLMLQKIGQEIVAKIRIDVFNHINLLSIDQVYQLPVGKLVTRVCNDPESISAMFTSTIVDIIKNTFLIVFVVAIMFILSWQLATIVCLMMPFLLLATWLFRRFTNKRYLLRRNLNSDANGFLSENLSGMKITQTFNQEDAKVEIYNEKITKIMKTNNSLILAFSLYRPFIYSLSMIATILVILFGKELVVQGVFLIGTITAINEYIRQFFTPVQLIAEQMDALQNSFASGEKIFDCIDTVPAILDVEDAIDLEVFNGEIEFKNVTFAYVDDIYVLKDVSFRIKPNQTVAFVGATGSGKSTILNLIVRNYEINEGTILIDGIDVRKISRKSLRDKVGQMLQDVFLFNATVKDNITLFDDTISLADVEEACKYIGADEFIQGLDNGYETMIRERGNNLSSGQRQLISFARAICYKPSLMILDEATANIDSETEQVIQKALTKMSSISTMIIVAHRLSTIQHADNIIVLHKGVLIEQGNHQTLLKNKNLYYNLYKIQYEGKVE